MSVNNAILQTQPTSYWPLDDDGDAASCQDAMGLHDAALPAQGVTLAVIPFGTAQAPYFDGALGSVLTIDDDVRYSQPHAEALTVAAWLCPLALDNPNTSGSEDQFVHYIEKAVGASTDTEWALRLYNKTNPTRHSRLSFYTFNLEPPGEGNGSFMEYGVSTNDETPVELGTWIFVVGEAERWISVADQTTGCILWKQGVQAERVSADKYGHYQVRPQHGPGPITIGGMQTTGFTGAIAHVAIWDRLLLPAEIASIWAAGVNDLRATAMYHSYT